MLNCAIFTINSALIAISAYRELLSLSHRHFDSIYRLTVKKDRFLANFANPSSVLFVPLVALNMSTILVGVMLYAHELGGFAPSDYPGRYLAVFW